MTGLDGSSSDSVSLWKSVMTAGLCVGFRTGPTLTLEPPSEGPAPCLKGSPFTTVCVASETGPRQFGDETPLEERDLVALFGVGLCLVSGDEVR